ncbi:transglutaminase TgpA family protein [Aeromonas jandaei]|uniref:transglutaminase TgpA family protein n=1 Tax=Aeromonas jandaei TaxID=650 RepID=UPI0038D06FD2
MQLDNRRLLPLIALQQLLLIAALWPQLQLWVMAVGAITLFTRAMMLWRGWRPPPARVLAILAIGCLLMLLLQWRGLGTLPALVNQLWLGYSLKLIEVRRDRDVEQVLLLAFFLIALALVQRQSIGWALLLALSLWLAVTALVNAAAPQQKHPWRSAGGALLLALPLLLTLFIVLPRLPPLWQMPTASRALTGLSEEVAPGDINELVSSSELVFRVTFADDPPPQYERYFPVMRQEYFDGRRWQLSTEVKRWQQTVPLLNVTSTLSDSPLPAGSYEVLAEPQRHRWAFAMTAPRVMEGPVQTTPIATLYRQGSNELAIRYRASTATLPDATERERQRNLQLPAEGNPQARAYARELATRYPEPSSLVGALMTRFRSQPYTYTLTPPRLGPDGVDDFLFDSRRGFCGHYAMATAFVLRAAGIPARLVTGYLGGEWNPQGSYLAVRQFDAHAWVEYLDRQQHWQRIDPTAAVAPDRIEGNMAQALGEQFAAADPLSLQRYRSWAPLNQLRWWGNNLDYQWSRWVLGHDASKLWQQVALRWPSLAGQIPWLILLSLLLIALMVSLPLLWPAREPATLRIWQPLLHRGNAVGCTVQAGETLGQWCERLATLRPALSRPLLQAAWLYRRWRYGPLTAHQQRRCLRQLKRRVRQICQSWDRQT